MAVYAMVYSIFLALALVFAGLSRAGDKEKGQTVLRLAFIDVSKLLFAVFGAANTCSTVPLNWGGGFHAPR